MISYMYTSTYVQTCSQLGQEICPKRNNKDNKRSQGDQESPRTTEFGAKEDHKPQLQHFEMAPTAVAHHIEAVCYVVIAVWVD